MNPIISLFLSHACHEAHIPRRRGAARHKAEFEPAPSPSWKTAKVPLFENGAAVCGFDPYGRRFLQSVTRSLQILDAETRDLQELGCGGLVLLGGIRKLAAQMVPELMQQFWPSDNGTALGCTESSFTADLLRAGRATRHGVYQPSGDEALFKKA